MSITAAEATKLDNVISEFQAEKLGTGLKAVQDIGAYDPIIVSLNITTDATGGLPFTIPYDFELLEVIVQARATVSNGTVTIMNGATPLTDAIIMAVDTTITRAGTLDNTVTTITTADTITAITAHAGDLGLICLLGYRA